MCNFCSSRSDVWIVESVPGRGSTSASHFCSLVDSFCRMYATNSHATRKPVPASRHVWSDRKHIWCTRSLPTCATIAKSAHSRYDVHHRGCLHCPNFVTRLHTCHPIPFATLANASLLMALSIAHFVPHSSHMQSPCWWINGCLKLKSSESCMLPGQHDKGKAHEATESI